MLKFGLVALCLTAPMACAETAAPAHDMATMQHGDGPATAAYQQAMDAMMAGMMIPYTGDADVDFIKGMIPHHQGAVDNARIVLQHGTDPDVRAFANAVIAAQEAEIKWMNDWLAARGE